MVPLRSIGYRPNMVERKVQDINTGTIQANTTGTFSLLCLPIVGADFNQRVGRKIIMKSVFIRGYVRTEQSGTLAVANTISQQARMILFVDLQPNGATPATTDLLVEATTASQLNLNYRDRFKILCDKEYVFDPYTFNTGATTSQSSVGRQIWSVKKYKKITQETIFGTSAGTIADINSGALYMFWIGSNPTGATDVNAVLSSRVRYTDA
jgi:hypothetical protein